MEETTTMEIKDNTFARQFETTVAEGLVSVEYSFQEKKIFLTRINTPEQFNDEEFISDLLKNIMNIALVRVVSRILMMIYPTVLGEQDYQEKVSKNS